MISVRDALALAGAQQSDLIAILKALEDDSVGYKGEDDASGPFTELNPAILGQPPYGLNIKRCNVVKKAIKHAQGRCLKCTCVVVCARRLMVCVAPQVLQMHKQMFISERCLFLTMKVLYASTMKVNGLHFFSCLSGLCISVQLPSYMCVQQLGSGPINISKQTSEPEVTLCFVQDRRSPLATRTALLASQVSTRNPLLTRLVHGVKSSQKQVGRLSPSRLARMIQSCTLCRWHHHGRKGSADKAQRQY